MILVVGRSFYTLTIYLPLFHQSPQKLTKFGSSFSVMPYPDRCVTVLIFHPLTLTVRTDLVTS